ncbi:MAG: CCA tRNA nucleotidyltransferase [Dehalococcoidia bacterium]|nr:CCA tRNA nucleotidyltransferase [Dehalococcoidia bacterium]
MVGGFVRDSLLGREAQDIDVVVSGDPFAIAQHVARQLGASFVPLDQEHCIARVVCAPARRQSDSPQSAAEDISLSVDFARYEGAIEENLSSRDFTIDAMAVPASVVSAHVTDGGMPRDSLLHDLIDPTGGLHDLEDGVIRVCGAHSFEADPGRLLRAVRLSRELNFTIEAYTESLLRTQATMVSSVAAERTREELLKLLALPNAAEGIRQLDRLGLLMEVLPELAACRDVTQPTSHFWDVLEHSIQTITTYEYLTGQADWRYGNDELRDFLPDDPAYRVYLATRVSQEASRDTLIKLTCLLHDVAKPQTKSIDDSGRARFLGHPREGAVVVGEMLKRLRFSSQEITFVETLVCHHLRPSQMSSDGMPTRRAVYRFFRDTGSAGIGVLYLAMADYLACRGPLFTMREWKYTCDLVNFTLREHERQQQVIAPSRLMDGSELMRALGLQPGPTVGVLLETIQEAQAEGLISTRDEALQLARKTIECDRSTVRISK